MRELDPHSSPTCPPAPSSARAAGHGPRRGPARRERRSSAGEPIPGDVGRRPPVRARRRRSPRPPRAVAARAARRPLLRRDGARRARRPRGLLAAPADVRAHRQPAPSVLRGAGCARRRDHAAGAADRRARSPAALGMQRRPRRARGPRRLPRGGRDGGELPRRAGGGRGAAGGDRGRDPRAARAARARHGGPVGRARPGTGADRADRPRRRGRRGPPPGVDRRAHARAAAAVGRARRRRPARLRAASARMRTIRTHRRDARVPAQRARTGRSVGLVPTMGAFHAGHHSLMRAAREHHDQVVVSLFVNPAQFNDAGDLAAYPRTEEQDAAEARGARRRRAVRAARPRRSTRAGFATSVQVAGPRRGARGRRARPGPLRRRLHRRRQAAEHRPARRRLLRPEGRPAGRRRHAAWSATSTSRSGSRSLPTVREPDGLALSSRNRRLYAARPRPRARALTARLQRRARGRRATASATPRACETPPAPHLDGVDPEYLAIVDPVSFTPLTTIDGPRAVAVAAQRGPRPPDRQRRLNSRWRPRRGRQPKGAAVSTPPRHPETSRPQARHADQARRDARAGRADRDDHRLRPPERARRRAGRRGRRAGGRLGRQQRARLRGHGAGHASRSC